RSPPISASKPASPSTPSAIPWERPASSTTTSAPKTSSCLPAPPSSTPRMSTSTNSLPAKKRSPTNPLPTTTAARATPPAQHSNKKGTRFQVLSCSRILEPRSHRYSDFTLPHVDGSTGSGSSQLPVVPTYALPP